MALSGSYIPHSHSELRGKRTAPIRNRGILEVSTQSGYCLPSPTVAFLSPPLKARGTRSITPYRG